MCQNGAGGGWVSVRMEWEKVGGCHPRVDQYMAACDIGCRTASVEFGSAASLLDRNESCRDSVLAVWSLTKC